MCGIAGLLRTDGSPADRGRLSAMSAAVAHRGPDGEGLLCEGPVGLAHRRLAIIDLGARAAQPMVCERGRFVLTYNGEIYNYRELRRELEASGVRFRTSSDSEVLLMAWAQWGSDALPRLNGMFAFAIWDRHRQTLFLA